MEFQVKIFRLGFFLLVSAILEADGPARRVDLTVWRPATGMWYFNPAIGSPTSVQWGLNGDIPVAADFDGDGKLDLVVWRPGEGNWYVKLSGSPGDPIVRQWGVPGDVPLAGDFDGDGKTDYGVWRPSNGTWYIIPSSTGIPISKQWGLPADIPIVADFDGDGKADFAVWRPADGTWRVAYSGSGPTLVKQWGLPGDVPMAADFDGDGKADLTVWRPAEGNWYIVSSSNPTEPFVRQLGLPGDVPLPRDYDGDGKSDLAVWRPSNGTWFIGRSGSADAPLQVQWGLPTDWPIYKLPPAGGLESALLPLPGPPVQGGTMALSLMFASSGSHPAGLQWTFSYPASDIQAISVTPGAAATAGGKSIYCAGSSGLLTCLSVGINSNTIANGVVAVVTATLSPPVTATSIRVIKTVGATPAGDAYIEPLATLFLR
jgi:hypothetical protein